MHTHTYALGPDFNIIRLGIWQDITQVAFSIAQRVLDSLKGTKLDTAAGATDLAHRFWGPAAVGQRILAGTA